MFASQPDVLDAQGRPRVNGRESGVPGLFFCGFDLSRGGVLREIGIEARRIARSIAARSGATGGEMGTSRETMAAR